VRGVVGQGFDDAFGGRWIEVFQGGQGFNFLVISLTRRARFQFVTLDGSFNILQNWSKSQFADSWSSKEFREVSMALN